MRHLGFGRGVVVVALAVLVALVVLGCGSASKKAAIPADQPPRSDAASSIVVQAGQPIVIGVSDAFTGSEAQAGAEDRDAVVASIMRWKAANGDQLLGHDIVIRAEDDGCTESDITKQAAERLLRTPGLVGVLGPGCSAGAKEAISRYAKAGIVVISGSATQSDLTTTQPAGDFFFRTSYRSDLQGLIGGQFVAGAPINAKTAYLIDDSESYGQDLVAAAAKEMESLGIAVTRASVPGGDVDFSALAKKIAQDSPDFVGFGGFNPQAVLLYRQLRDAGYKGAFGSGDAAASVSTFVDPVGAAAAEGVYFVGCPLVLPDDFLRDFVKVHGGEPVASAFTAQYADATTVLLNAVAGVANKQDDGSLIIDPAALRQSVSQTKLDNGISGDVAFDANGDRSTNATDLAGQARDLGLAACQVQSGKLVNLFP